MFDPRGASRTYSIAAAGPLCSLKVAKLFALEKLAERKGTQ